MEISVNDRVRFLNDVGGGTVTKIIDRMSVLVMNEFGFEVPVKNFELVVIEQGAVFNEEKKGNNADQNAQSTGSNEELVVDTKDIFYPDVAIDETNGDDVNLYFSFVPQGRPGNSDLNVFLINDSNYNVLYSIINVDAQGRSFSNSVGVLEANTKEQFETLGMNSVNEIPEYIFHLVFYKKGDFSPKEPLTKSIKINPVKFYKEKAYTVNDFFNEDSLMISLIADSVLLNQVNKLSEKDLRKVVQEKEAKEPKVEYASSKEKENILVEVDLHIHELLDDFRGLSNSEILEVQMDHFKSKLEEVQKAKMKKVVFIHGVGAGTLKLELRKELERKSKILIFQDASFKEYGYGATLVKFK